ncbi:hypothetical protein FI667_g16598, partial [Globisporangium splendens]
MHAADSSRRQYPPNSSMSMRSSHRHHQPPPSSSANGPLTAERHMMEQIRLKLEHAQQRLVHRHAVESATPGSSRYYPPNYTSTQAKHPAPPVQSVKLEDLSLHVAAHQYTSSSTASSSGYMGVYPPQSTRDPYVSQRRPPPSHRDHTQAPTTNSTRPTRQNAPPPSNYVPSSSRTHRHHHQQPMSRREYRQQYPPELQYRSSSRNPHASSRGQEQYTGAPLSTSAPFLVYSSSHHAPHEKKHGLQNPPTSAIEVPPALQPALQPANQKNHHHHQHRDESEKEDKKEKKRDDSPPPEAPPASAVRSTMASAMRSPVQPPPSSRVRFEGYPSPPESEEARTKRKEHEAEKAKERQREKEKQLRDVLRQERQRRSVSRDAADAHDHMEKEQRAEGRARRGSLPAPPKSEIDVSAFEQAVLVLPVSPSGRTRRNSLAAAPPKSAIQVSAFDEAPVRRRSSAADEHAVKQQQVEEPTASSGEKHASKAVKRDTSSDDDDYRTPPTSPSSGGSSSEPGFMVTTKEEANAADEVPTESVLPISVKAVKTDYDDAMPFVASNQQDEGGLRSPSKEKKKPFLSIWDNDDEEAIISASLSSPALSKDRNQKPQSPAHHEPDPRMWAMRDDPEEEEGKQVSNQEVEEEEEQVASPVLEFSDDPISPVEEAESAVEAPPPPVKEDKVVTEASSNQELLPVTKPPAVSSRTPGSRSNRPDLRSRISAAIQAFNAPENGEEGATKSPPTRMRSPVTEPRQPRPLSPALPPPSRPSNSFLSQRPPNTTTAARAGSMTSSSLRPTLTPTVTRPRPPLPPPPSAHSGLPAPPTTQGRRLRHKEPLELKRQLPPQIGVLAGLASGPTTFTLNEYAFYEIEWKVGEFGFSFQRVYAEPDPYDRDHENQSREMYLRMLLNTDRSTCKSFRDVHVGDILIQIGDTKVSDLGFDSIGVRDSGSALTKYFTELRMQTPMRLVFQRTEVMDWEGGVEL